MVVHGLAPSAHGRLSAPPARPSPSATSATAAHPRAPLTAPRPNHPVDFDGYDGYAVLEDDEFLEYAETDWVLRKSLDRIREIISKD